MVEKQLGEKKYGYVINEGALTNDMPCAYATRYDEP